MDPLTIATIGSLGISAATGVYNAIAETRNNQELMARDDNSIQRRVADYAAAGFNPLLAVGSSGASTSKTTAPTLTNDLANGLSDVAVAKYQNEMIKQQVEQSKAETDILKFQRSMAEDQSRMYYHQQLMDTINLYNQLGLTYGIYGSDNGDNTFHLDVMHKPFDKDGVVPLGLNKNLPIQKQFQTQMDLLNDQALISKNNLHISDVNSNWATANMIMDSISKGVGIGTDIVGGVTGIKKAFDPFQPIKPEVKKTTSKTRIYNNYGYSDYYTY